MIDSLTKKYSKEKSDKKTVYILVGPKGCGKSYIGNLLEKRLGLTFLRVEPLAIAYIEKHGLPDGGLKRDGFDLEEAEIHKILASKKSVVFEATGSSKYFSSVLENLRQLYEVKLIRIHCPLELCYLRVKNRDQKDHHVVADDMIRVINNKADKVMLDWNLEIDNSGPASEESVISQFSNII